MTRAELDSRHHTKARALASDNQSLSRPKAKLEADAGVLTIGWTR